MKKEIIEERLRQWFASITIKYPWLSIKFEYGERKGAYLVSFSPVTMIELSDEFNLDAMQFEEDLVREFGYDAPLFTDEEKLFKLSAEAEVISSGSYFSAASSLLWSAFVTVQNHGAVNSWSSPSAYTTSPTSCQSDTVASYAIAA